MSVLAELRALVSDLKQDSATKKGRDKPPSMRFMSLYIRTSYDDFQERRLRRLHQEQVQAIAVAREQRQDDTVMSLMTALETTVSQLTALRVADDEQELRALLVPAIVKPLNNVVAKNNKMMAAVKLQVAESPFNAPNRRVPPFSLESYVQRLLVYARCSSCMFVLAVLYIDRVIQRHANRLDFAVTSLNVHRLLLASLVVAIKTHEDYYRCNAFYARVGGVTVQELNKLELNFLLLLDFQVQDMKGQYKAYALGVEELIGMSGQVKSCPANNNVIGRTPSSPKRKSSSSRKPRPHSANLESLRSQLMIIDHQARRSDDSSRPPLLRAASSSIMSSGMFGPAGSPTNSSSNNSSSRRVAKTPTRCPSPSPRMMCRKRPGHGKGSVSKSRSFILRRSGLSSFIDEGEQGDEGSRGKVTSSEAGGNQQPSGCPHHPHVVSSSTPSSFSSSSSVKCSICDAANHRLANRTVSAGQVPNRNPLRGELGTEGSLRKRARGWSKSAEFGGVGSSGRRSSSGAQRRGGTSIHDAVHGHGGGGMHQLEFEQATHRVNAALQVRRRLAPVPRGGGGDGGSSNNTSGSFSESSTASTSASASGSTASIHENDMPVVVTASECVYVGDEGRGSITTTTSSTTSRVEDAPRPLRTTSGEEQDTHRIHAIHSSANQQFQRAASLGSMRVWKQRQVRRGKSVGWALEPLDGPLPASVPHHGTFKHPDATMTAALLGPVLRVSSSCNSKTESSIGDSLGESGVADGRDDGFDMADVVRGESDIMARRRASVDVVRGRLESVPESMLSESLAFDSPMSESSWVVTKQLRSSALVPKTTASTTMMMTTPPRKRRSRTGSSPAVLRTVIRPHVRHFQSEQDLLDAAVCLPSL